MLPQMNGFSQFELSSIDMIGEQDPASGVAATSTSPTLGFEVETAEKAQVETNC